MLLEIERALEGWLASGRRRIGQILIEETSAGTFVLRHRDDEKTGELASFQNATEAAAIARFDDAENYRPLKTAPNLRHGWRLELPDISSLRQALDLFYPGRLALLVAAEKKALVTTPLRATLARQTGMYRVASRITDSQADALVGSFCRSRGGTPGCLRAILWKRDAAGAPASAQLPPEKFDPAEDQTGRGGPVIPLLCQEACNLLVAEARKIVKSPNDA